ncbi:MAG TPA: hypothetical protein VHO01_04940, partial [Jatrophihabitans sp.]|nr:hypothetical protein [Jatrophihabitans sp.]
AHSHVGGVRWWNVKHPARYAAALERGVSPAAGRETLDEQARFTERLMLQLRMVEGLALAQLPAAAVRHAQQCVSWGLAERPALTAGRLVLTQRGRLLADAVVRDLLLAVS